jgi:hypothetical protein
MNKDSQYRPWTPQSLQNIFKDAALKETISKATHLACMGKLHHIHHSPELHPSS